MRFLLQHGRLTSNSKGESPSFQVHKGKFVHFYAFGLVYLYCLCSRAPSITWKVLLTLQLARRLLESIFLFAYSPSSKMHILHYFVGISYYPVLVECVARAPATLHWTRIVLFLLFSMVQSHAHWTIGKASKTKEAREKRLPLNCGLFSVLCCPHYTAEVAIYWTLCCSPLLAANALFTTLNLSVSAVQVQQKDTSSRKKYAIIPFLL